MLKRYYITSNDLADRWKIPPENLQFAIALDYITPFPTDDGTAFDWMEVVAHEIRADLPDIAYRLQTIESANELGMHGRWVDQYARKTLQHIVLDCGKSPYLYDLLNLFQETQGVKNG